MRYIRCTLELDPVQPASEIFIAALSELGFESFEETETGLNAYIREPLWKEADFLDLPYLTSPSWTVRYTIERIEPENWNAVWEREYEPIAVGERCRVRAPFHPPVAGIPYEIEIAPKMSFGTGHHQTTWLMLDYLLDLDLQGKEVVDMGSGTGVLAILAAMRGASRVTAIDIDPWAYENCRENILRNGQPNVEVLQGDARLLAGRQFDVVLANINKNILLADLPAYAGALAPGGQVLISGFYRADLPDLREAAQAVGLHYREFREKEAWTAALFAKD
jgi:ribosomal protein L11 methyltransferase